MFIPIKAKVCVCLPQKKQNWQHFIVANRFLPVLVELSVNFVFNKHAHECVRVSVCSEKILTKVLNGGEYDMMLAGTVMFTH